MIKENYKKSEVNSPDHFLQLCKSPVFNFMIFNKFALFLPGFSQVESNFVIGFRGLKVAQVILAQKLSKSLQKKGRLVVQQRGYNVLLFLQEKIIFVQEIQMNHEQSYG